MLTEINSSKETIKNRMLKHALNYWSIKNTDDLDPAVKLILEALASELYNLGNEIRDTQVRILEKIANLLTPDFLTAPNPAHALLHALPSEPTEKLTSSTGFFTQKKISSRQNEVLDTNLDIHFTTVDTVKLFDARVAYIASGDTLFSIDASFNKQPVARGRNRQASANALWLGLSVNARVETMEGLFFCFDWKNTEPKLAHRIYQLLPLTKWFVNDALIETRPGLPYVESEKDSYESLFADSDLLSMMEKDIKQFYEPKYISITQSMAGNFHETKQTYPAAFTNQFAVNDLARMTEKLVWIKVVFPDAMQPEFLNDTFVYTNTLPVMNRLCNGLKYRLKGGSNIIPLRTGTLEQFFSVKSLSDETREYRSVPYRKMNEEESGTYTLRSGGVERFDTRNARELISYLMELLRSESAAFSAYGYDFIAGTLREMNQKISLMEQKTKGYINNAAEQPNYIIVKPFEDNDMMHTEYWTTLAEVANSLRAGTKLQQVKGVKVKSDSIILMTTTTGGKGRLKPEERLNAFRYGLMTRNRIITKEDIRNFCFYELGERLRSVEIERGFEISPLSQESFRRTIDIILTPVETRDFEMREWNFLCDQLKVKLQARSGMSNYYRIMLRDEVDS